MAVPDTRAHERSVAELAVLQACILTKRVQSSVTAVSKEDKSPVTIADFAAQALLVATVRNAFPDDGFVGEEDSAVLRQDKELCNRVWELVQSVRVPSLNDEHGLPGPASVEDMLDLIDLGGSGQGGPKGRFWVMDPVDGTRTFLRGEQYAVSLALIEDGLEVVGVLGCPNLLLRSGRVQESVVDKHGLGILLSAVKDQGTTCRNLRDWKASSPSLAQLTCSPAQRLPRTASIPESDSALHIIDSINSKASRHDIVQALATRLGAVYPGTDIWSSHVRYAALVVGGGDFQIRVPGPASPMPCIWDHAGAQLIFTEAGGRIRDLDDKPIDFGAGRTLSGNRGMIIARHGIHDTITNMVKDLLDKEAQAAT